MKLSTTSLMLATATAMRALDTGTPLFKPLTEKPRNAPTKKRSRPEEPSSLPTTPTSSTAGSSDEDEYCAKKKCVRWSTVTVYEFGVTIGGSAVPRRGGPAIGLAKKPKTIWSATVDAIEYETCSSEDSDNAASVVVDTDKENVEAMSNRPVARRRRVRWFKPLERVQLLTEAGCSEKRIYRTMMESSEIAMSRRLSISAPRKVAA